MIYLTCPKNKKFEVDVDKLLKGNVEETQIGFVRVTSIYGEGEAPIISNKKFEIIPNTESNDVQIFLVEADYDVGGGVPDTLSEVLILFPEKEKPDKVFLKHSGYKDK